MYISTMAFGQQTTSTSRSAMLVGEIIMIKNSDQMIMLMIKNCDQLIMIMIKNSDQMIMKGVVKS